VVYGVLQVLYVQQDATRTIATCSGLSLEFPKELADIREVRNDSLGHPTGRGAFISRSTLSPDGFQFLVPSRKGFRETDVYWCFLAAKVRELFAHADEIDKDYDSDDVRTVSHRGIR
jgi:hypothetical protein